MMPAVAEPKSDIRAQAKAAWARLIRKVYEMRPSRYGSRANLTNRNGGGAARRCLLRNNQLHCAASLGASKMRRLLFDRDHA